MKKPKIDKQRIGELIVVMGIFGTIFTALNFKLITPADALQTHIVEEAQRDTAHQEAFQHHLDDFGDYLAAEEEKDSSRAARTELMEAQTIITCMRTGRDTLAMAGLVQRCDELTGNR